MRSQLRRDFKKTEERTSTQSLLQGRWIIRFKKGRQRKSKWRGKHKGKKGCAWYICQGSTCAPGLRERDLYRGSMLSAMERKHFMKALHRSRRILSNWARAFFALRRVSSNSASVERSRCSTLPSFAPAFKFGAWNRDSSLCIRSTSACISSALTRCNDLVRKVICGRSRKKYFTEQCDCTPPKGRKQL